MKKEKGPLLLLNLDKSSQPETVHKPDSTIPSGAESAPADSIASSDPVPARPPDVPEFATLQKRPWLLTDLLRAFLIVLSLVVALGLILILLPQSAIDRMSKGLQSRHATARLERIALLYLGDEAINNAFHIRGVVRNITTAPIEQLDAAIRLYGHDGTILETTVVRMNKETVAPDEVAQFELVYPNYKMEFSKYSVEFKLREGGIVSYTDMRATR